MTMFDTLPELDQSVATLQACYSYAGQPREVDRAGYAERGLDWKLLRYGAQARQRIYCETLAGELSQLSAPAACAAFGCARTMREFIWFTFGQKRWDLLFDLVNAIDDALLGAVGPEVCDLFLMACLRAQPEAFVKARARAGLLASLGGLAARYRSLWPEAPGRADVIEAIALHLEGRVAEARTRLASFDEMLCGPMRAVSTVLPPQARRAVDLGQVTLVRRAPQRRVLMLSCDGRYFERYFETLCRSFRAARGEGEDWGLHVHCVGFDPKDRPAPEGFDAQVGVTIDKTPLDGRRGNWKGAYCAAARYLYAPFHLRIYDQLMISDIDGVFPDALEDWLPDSRGCDVALCSNLYLAPQKQLNPLPWNAIPAGFVLLRGTPGAHRFAQAVAGYLAAIFQAPGFDGSPWFADQNALFYSHIDLEGEVSVHRLRKIPFRQAFGWQQFTTDQRKQSFAAAGGASR